MSRNIIAHIDANGESEQLLSEHLIAVSKRTKEIGEEIGLGHICCLVGVLHDIGKQSDLFQKYIRGEHRGKVTHSTAGARVLDYLQEELNQQYKLDEGLLKEGIKEKNWPLVKTLYQELLQYPILAHHGLYDIINWDFKYQTKLRFDREECKKGELKDCEKEFLKLLNEDFEKQYKATIVDTYYQGFLEFINLYNKMTKMAQKMEKFEDKDNKVNSRLKARSFYFGVTVRLLLSILKEGDIYDSANYAKFGKDYLYNQNELNEIWKSLEEKIEVLYKGFEEKADRSELDLVRSDMADNLHQLSLEHKNGNYKLDMPVGAGKTFAALRYAVSGARAFEKKRIYYCTAYLSILEQNAKEIKGVLGEEYLLEHHSNVAENNEVIASLEKKEKEEDESKKDKDEYKNIEYLKESWESPVVLTTLVQMFNTLFKGRASNIRRFSKLINSTIIIDEVQSLPLKTTYIANLMMNYLAEVLNCTIVHSTATQPYLDNQILFYPCFYNHEEQETMVELVEDAQVFHRVNYYHLMGEDIPGISKEELISHLKTQLKSENSALVVINTKKAVANLYNALLEDEEIQSMGTEVIYLTTNQCPKHRLDLIDQMKVKLKTMREGSEQSKLICVSTKLIEAGVDIDFDIVYRALAGLDSVIQCGGRCNREGKKDSKGSVFIFEDKDENLSRLKEIQDQKEAAGAVLRLANDQREAKDQSPLEIEKLCKDYFQKLYANNTGDKNTLKYPIGKTSILDLLSTNPYLISAYKNMEGLNPASKVEFELRQSFKTAADEFQLIDDNAISVIVHYNNQELIERLHEYIEQKDYQAIKQTLRELQKYTIAIRRPENYERYIGRELDGEIYILNKNAYDINIGLNAAELESLIH